jgi:hypothetical protein
LVYKILMDYQKKSNWGGEIKEFNKKNKDILIENYSIYIRRIRCNLLTRSRHIVQWLGHRTLISGLLKFIREPRFEPEYSDFLGAFLACT